MEFSTRDFPNTPLVVTLPISAVVPTRHRTISFRATLASIAGQSTQPYEVIVVDASDDTSTERLCKEGIPGLLSQIRWFRAKRKGAAAQRNEGIQCATQQFIAFFDDDILFEPECIDRLWSALVSDPKMGGVNATITNQMYSPPGRVTRVLLPVLAGRRLPSYAGRVLGPGINQLPADDPTFPEVVPVDWLNTTCTLYRRIALPDPPFPDHFTGYSMCEDLTLSLTVGRNWKLANARTARIFHDSQPGDHKRSHARLAAMELVNRHFVMTRVLRRQGVGDYLRFALWEAFQVAATIPGGIRRVAAEIAGKIRGLFTLSREWFR
jgi:glycosyltransferase involved in cell wall biosynthesis